MCIMTMEGMTILILRKALVGIYAWLIDLYLSLLFYKKATVDIKS
jgi:hypothetical protein